MEFRKWLENFEIHGYNPDDSDEDQDGMYDAAHDIAKNSGIRILRDKELSSVAKNAEGKIIGALYTSIQQDKFSFDIVVDPNFQKQGVGTKLVKDAISLYNNQKWDMPELEIEADVVSASMESILSKMGWKVKQRVAGHTIMTP